MKSKVTILSILAFAILSSGCKEEEVGKDGDTTPGTWTATFGSGEWKAGRVQRVDVPSTGGMFFNGYRDSDNSVMVLIFNAATLPPGTYEIPAGVEAGYYTDVNLSASKEDATEGSMQIKKFDTDSLVATFSFKTPKSAFTNGNIKIKLK